MFKPLLTSAILILSSQILNAAETTFTYNETSQTVATADTTYRLGSDLLYLSPEKSSSPYVFNDAISAIEAVNRSPRKATLLVAPSVYWLDNPDDPTVKRNAQNSQSIPFAVEIKCDTLSIIGLAEKPEDVVFAVNRGQTQGAIGNYTMIHFYGNSLETHNLTFGNYCNVDLIYPRNLKLNRTKRGDAIVQAQLGICENTDRLFAQNCRFISRLNLCPLVGARRSLYKNCYFECTDDALTGSAVYLDCRFTFHSGKPFYSTPTTGAVFLNCDIHTLTEGVQYLTKVPGMVTMIDTRFTSERPVKLQWTRDASPVRCYQSNISLNGSPVTIDADRPNLSVDISNAKLLDAYKVILDGKTIYNTPNLLAGNDGWDPLGELPAIKEAEKKFVKYLRSLPIALIVNSSTEHIEAQGDTVSFATVPLMWGDYISPMKPSGIRWEAPTTLKLHAKGIKMIAVSRNPFPRQINNTISATTDEGLVGATAITIAPFLKDAPDFAATPEIVREKSQLKINYKLTSHGTDNSYIVWYRSKRPDAVDTIPVRHGHGFAATTYQLSSADNGYFISAAIIPALSDTKGGELRHIRHYEGVVTKKMSKSSPDKERTISTSFAEIPLRGNNRHGRSGFWCFDSYKPADTKEYDWTPNAEERSWYYGQATDAATGIGLVQAQRGARLSYTPIVTTCKSMRLSLVAEPCKGPGQGFGSATGQYMDICVRFDPQTLSGYALRIQRTPEYDKAVTFTLVRYSNGKVTPISAPTASNCYRNPCNISISIDENAITATATTDAPAVSSTNPNVKPEVNISAPVTVPTTHSSFAIQHTGSVGASATLIRNLTVEWE